jgi:hypothetical protein
MRFHQTPHLTKAGKFTILSIIVSVSITLFFAILCEIIEIDKWYSLIPTIIGNILFSYHKQSTLNWIESKNNFFWAIMAGMFLVCVVFVIEIFVKFYLQISG